MIVKFYKAPCHPGNIHQTPLMRPAIFPDSCARTSCKVRKIGSSWRVTLSGIEFLVPCRLRLPYQFLKVFVSQHHRHCCWHSSHEVGPYPCIECTPSFFAQYQFACVYKATISRWGRHAIRGGLLLCLKSGPQNLVWIRRSAGTDFAQECSGGNSNPSATTLLWRMLTNAVTGKLHLEILVEWKLHGDVGETEKAGRQTRIECSNALGAIHLSGGVKRGRIVPRCSQSVAARTHSPVALGHESSLDDPDGICQNCGACASGQRRVASC
jgi:hypothetical protein